MSVCVLGSINLDHFMLVDTLPRGGETLAATRTFQAPGGKGANQAIAAARTGIPTRMIGAVGDDAAGRVLRDYLGSNGVDVSDVAILESQLTGAAYVTLSKAGENHIIVAPNANARLVLPAGNIMHDAHVALAQLETPVDIVARFFAHAAARGAICVLNAAPAVTAARTLFEGIDVLIVNQVELAAFLSSDSVVSTPDDAAAARRLLVRPDQIAIVTLGSAGAVLVGRDRLIHVPAVVVREVVDTTGAGDCFCGVIAALLSDGREWDDILQIANQAAAMCIQHEGAVSAKPANGIAVPA